MRHIVFMLFILSLSSTAQAIDEPPSGIVFTPNDVLKLELHSELRGKAEEKDKDGMCASDILILGTVRDNGQ
jgi:hypothetical protein